MHAQSWATNSPLVQIRSDCGSTQTEKQIMPHTMQALENTDKLSISDALSGPNAEQWHSAMDTKVAQLLNLDTFELVSLLADWKIIGCHWVLALKQDTSGDIIKFNAQLVAHGFSLILRIDFDETFSLL